MSEARQCSEQVIYILKRKSDGAVGYVGRTALMGSVDASVAVRFKGHRRRVSVGDTPVSRWFAEVGADDIDIHPISICKTSAATDLEAFWMRVLWDEGHRLLNSDWTMKSHVNRRRFYTRDGEERPEAFATLRAGGVRRSA